MIYHALILPHLGQKPGAELAKYMRMYKGVLRHCKGFMGVEPCLDDEATYALFIQKVYADAALERFWRFRFEEVRYAGKRDVPDNKIRSLL